MPSTPPPPPPPPPSGPSPPGGTPGSSASTSPAASSAQSGMGRRRRSAKQASWMAHVKATMRAHRGISLREALKKAKLTYKKGMRGGFTTSGDPQANISASPLGGAGRRGRSRRGGRSRRRGGNTEY